MKTLGLIVFFAGMAAAQAPPAQSLPNLPDDTVIAIFDDGGKLTMGQYKSLYEVLRGNQPAMLADRKTFLEQYALMRKLAHIAEEEKLDQASPGKDLLEYYRLFLLTQTELNHAMNNQNVSQEDIGKYYDANKESYRVVKVKAIYITFSKVQASQSNNGKQVLTEEEAKAKAEKLLADLRGGADFVKLARENSDDATSRDRDGDFATLTGTDRDKLPPAVVSTILALKQGEVSEPVEQPNGFYLFRADQVGYRPLPEVQGEILTKVQQDHFAKWMQTIHDSIKVEFPSQEFLSGTPGAK
jgi:peptidyl-prolyl cis-trans isomerase C